MNIWFCINADIHANRVLNECLPRFEGHDVSVFMTQGVGNADGNNKHYQQLAKLEAAEVLFTAIDNQELEPGPLKTFKALEKFANFKTVKTLSELENESTPDLVISVRFALIFTQDWIKKTKILNLHSGVLPKYRGILGTLYAILNNESEIGCSLHEIDEKIDSGTCLATYKQPVTSKSLFHQIHSLYEPGTKLILESGLHYPEPISDKLGEYRSIPNDEAFDELQRKGIPIVNEAEDIAIYQACTNTPLTPEFLARV